MTRREKKQSAPVFFFSPGIYPCACAGMELFNYHMAAALAKEFPVFLASCCRIPMAGVRMVYLQSRLFVVKRFGLGRFSLILSSLATLLWIRPKPGIACVSATSSTGFYGFIFPLIRKVRSIPYIVIMHGGGLKKWRWLSGNRNLFQHADRIFAVSEPIRQEMERRCHRPIELILPLLPFQSPRLCKSDLKGKLGFSNESLVLLNVGALKPLKGVMDVLEAFLSLGAHYLRGRRLVLVFAGDGPQRKELQHRAADNLEMRDHILFLGKVPHEKIHDVYGAADLFVMASRFEGTPLALLEAMFNSLAIIASDAHGNRQLIRDNENGLLFTAGDREALRERIEILVEDHPRAFRLGQSAAKNFRTRFDFQNSVNKLKSALFQFSGGVQP